MMRPAIFARTFRRDSLDQVLDAIVATGIREVQFNFSCAGLEPLPHELDRAFLDGISDAHRKRRLRMIAMSGTFNAIHPDLAVRKDFVRRCTKLIEASAYMNVPLVTLCTGTRCPEDMWTAHPDNTMPSAWADLCRTLEPLIEAAEAHGVFLGIEPERSNVVQSANLARRLLDEMRSPRLRIIMDGANLIDPKEIDSMPSVLRHAFDLLEHDIISVHAKELPKQGETKMPAPGAGQLPWSHYFELMGNAGYHGPVILHNLNEDAVPAAKAFIEQFMNAASYT